MKLSTESVGMTPGVVQCVSDGSRRNNGFWQGAFVSYGALWLLP